MASQRTDSSSRDAAQPATRRKTRGSSDEKPARRSRAASRVTVEASEDPTQKRGRAKQSAADASPAFNPYANIDDTLDAIEKHIGLSESTMDKSEVRQSTGNLVLDLVLGGGITAGWYTNFGPEQSCKSTGASTMLAAAVRDQVPIISMWDYEGSSTPDYLENIFKNVGVRDSVSNIFGVRDASGKYIVPPKVRYKSEGVAEKFFDYVAKLERTLPDKKKIGDQWYYIYEGKTPDGKIHKENQKIVGSAYDAGYFRKTGNYRIPASDGRLQAVILLDSYPAMLPEKLDVDDPNSAIGAQARMFSEQIKRVKGKLRSKRIAVIGINQLRMKPMVMYGCFHYQQRVRLADGSWDYIGRIVSQKRKVKVLSYNTVTGRFEPKRVVGWYNNGNAEQGDFLKIRVQAGSAGGYNDIVCTKNHLLFDYAANAMRHAAEFKVGDTLTTDEQVAEPSDDLWQVVYGSFLGDGAFGNKRLVPSMSVSHSFGQEDYLLWKAKVLAAFDPAVENCAAYASLRVSLPMPELVGMIDEYKSSRYGRVYNGLPEAVFEKLGLPGLAVWYCDDGTFYDASKHHAGRHYWNMGISAKRLSDAQKVRLAAKITMLTGASIAVTNGGFGTNTKDEIRKFHDAIAPYVPECMAYKLYEGCSNVGTYKWRTRVSYKIKPFPACIVKIEEYRLPKGVSKGKFDLEVEGNHTYMVGNCVVHNSPEYEPCGEALRYFSDVRLKFTSRALSAAPEAKGKGQIEEEPSILHSNGVDTYRYIHVRGHKNKLSRPYVEGWIRLWIADAKNAAQGFDPVFDTYTYLKSTGQVQGKRGKMLLQFAGNEASKYIGWLDFKRLILGDRATIKAICETAGMKPFKLRDKCFQQLSSGKGLDLFNSHALDSRDGADDSDDGDGDDD